MRKTEAVFKELIGLHGAKFVRANGHIGGEVFKKWVPVIEPQDSEELRQVLINLKKQHTKHVAVCKCSAIPTIDTFRGLTKCINEQEKC